MIQAERCPGDTLVARACAGDVLKLKLCGSPSTPCLCDYVWEVIVTYCNCGTEGETGEITGGVLLIKSPEGDPAEFDASTVFNQWVLNEFLDLGDGCYQVIYHYNYSYDRRDPVTNPNCENPCVTPTAPTLDPIPPCPL